MAKSKAEVGAGLSAGFFTISEFPKDTVLFIVFFLSYKHLQTPSFLASFVWSISVSNSKLNFVT